MAQLFEFIGNHALLVLAFVGVLSLLLWQFFGENLQGGVERLGPLDAVQLINREEAVVLDVRETSEYEGGHILNAVHVPLGGLNGQLKRLEKYRNRPIIIGCLSGNRSVQACHLLKKNGFEKVYNLKGGVIAWQNASLPLSRGKDKQLKEK